ncbi:MAG: hypothetical protein GTO51_03335 [Candidatus Latescibacteria bacterium]|nr:hypothetical protein [Candidatus Latescibacterota bacterium]NIM20871.1 hypothetical protein [Candidatus Latescibacterota bacterium]NIM65006.1 hypothetical protein [Candidatus Latescibacterota bacterium]NIO01521.1 hypothetical protein [Candidatus Latescibacterota bacterium]NIO28038.1 hypothetical protein [Candidatus Latescibacterota bacterium]
MRVIQSRRWVLLSLIIMVSGAVIVSCAVQQRAQKPVKATKDKPYRFETEGEIPPLEESDVVRETDYEEVPVTEEEVLVEEMELPPPDTLRGAPAPAEMVEGFRVQVFATANEETAEAVRVSAERKLELPVYTEMIEGLFKVRVGDCRNREEAEKLLKRCQGAGYGDAWIVETLVLLSPAAP